MFLDACRIERRRLIGPDVAPNRRQQLSRKGFLVQTVGRAGIRHCVEYSYGTADAEHPVTDEYADRAGPAAHDLVDRHARVDSCGFHSGAMSPSKRDQSSLLISELCAGAKSVAPDGCNALGQQHCSATFTCLPPVIGNRKSASRIPLGDWVVQCPADRPTASEAESVLEEPGSSRHHLV